MNILIVNSFYYPTMIGGAEHSVKNLAETLVKYGHNVSVLCVGEIDQVEDINGVTVYRFMNKNLCNALEYQKGNVNKFAKIPYRFFDYLGVLNDKKIRKIISDIAPDIVHVNNVPGIGVYIFNLLKEMNIKSIFTARDYFLLCPKLTLMSRKENICTKKKLGCKCYERTSLNYLKDITCITAPSKYTLGLYEKGLNDYPITFRTINNSIDLDTVALNNLYEQKLMKQDDTLNLVYLGNLDNHKGVKILIEQFLKLNDASVLLHIAGDGPLKDDILKLKNPNIIYHGKLNQTELSNLLIKMDVLIAPSLWAEPFGRIVLDAYKHCMPVITTGQGGLKELVVQDQTGKIIDINDYNEFKDAIYFYKNKSNLYSQIKLIMNEIPKYSNEKIIKEYEQLYRELINRVN